MLSLARAGATDFARAEFVRLGLSASNDPEALSLGARLLKDVALTADGARRRAFARASARGYVAAAANGGGPYGLVNAATMSLLAGEAARTADLAMAALDAGAAAGQGDADYFHRASRAEALFLLGRRDEAADMLAAAVASAPASLSAHASTLRQLSMIAAEIGAPTAWLEILRPPATAHFTGHMFAVREPAEEAVLKARMADLLRARRIGFGYGGLAAGADILWAETLLAAGGELHVVAPLALASYVETSVRPFGERWVGRFEACLARATSVRFAARDPYAGDDEVFAYASRFAVGCAILRAEGLSTQAVQVAVWDGRPAAGPAGAAADVAYWRETGRPQAILPFDRPAPASPAAPPAGLDERGVKAMLFIDVRGFGALHDAQVPAFFEVIMAGMAEAIAGLAAPPEHVETWGDGVFLVFDQPCDAAEAALALLESHRGLNLRARGLPRHLALRIGGHYGPVHLRVNPITGAQAVVGAHVVVAARIEPDVAPGAAYVSEAMAGVLATRHADLYRCGYVGRTTPRKSFPPVSIFNLSRR
ncbi:adenylate/guanylate cyclase domain-containing protein [Caulobacter endophyticus]|uniref:adenylate/guanylate cyclase domain-containing protein n=1 Tax=Caulobacter endophyticus TaxID=2172652 RepID=UPI00240F35A5|nr:adenylate/guanylate cyclase domain-containing protein [Caulobacter endophyticus]MDG2528005.1 adenylate/guanylate cyclase domain-containing protein [Caulobacter endophyticus]